MRLTGGVGNAHHGCEKGGTVAKSEIKVPERVKQGEATKVAKKRS